MWGRMWLTRNNPLSRGRGGDWTASAIERPPDEFGTHNHSIRWDPFEHKHTASEPSAMNRLFRRSKLRKKGCRKTAQHFARLFFFLFQTQKPNFFQPDLEFIVPCSEANIIPETLHFFQKKISQKICNTIFFFFFEELIQTVLKLHTTSSKSFFEKFFTSEKKHFEIVSFELFTLPSAPQSAPKIVEKKWSCWCFLFGSRKVTCAIHHKILSYNVRILCNFAAAKSPKTRWFVCHNILWCSTSQCSLLFPPFYIISFFPPSNQFLLIIPH